MPATPPIQALLFDLGGVVIDIDFERVFAHWAQFSALSAAEIRARCVFDETYHRYERGETDDAAFFDYLRRLLALDADDAQILAGWNAVFVGQNGAVLDLIATVSTQRPSFAFTNTSASHQAAWSHAYPDVVGAFRRIFSSTEMGMRKPELDAFRHVVDAIGVDPGRILFFDDMPSNIDGARAAGLQAVQVQGNDDVRAGLRAAGLLPPASSGPA